MILKLKCIYILNQNTSEVLKKIGKKIQRVKLEVYRRAPRNEEELRRFILEEWANLDNNQVINMAKSFQRRLEMVLEAEGGYIQY